MTDRIRVAIYGASGYSGQELTRLLCRHPNVVIDSLVSHSYAGKPFSSLFPAFTGCLDQPFVDEKSSHNKPADCDLIFFALPHGHAAERLNESFLEHQKIIDLSADFRLRDPAQYDAWYEFTHPNPEFLSIAVYGLPEWRRSEIANARLVANPGCYATCTLLALLPFAQSGIIKATPIVDAKSGVSGAGRSASIETHFNECNESLKAYKVASHRHTPEIEQELSCSAGKALQIVFTPHLIPMNRGILVTSYLQIDSSTKESDLYEILQSKYANEPFVKVLKLLPETRWVKGSNSCHIGLRLDRRTGQAIVISTIDNLLKGAASQAVQNMNLMFGLPETTGLEQLAAVP